MIADGGPAFSRPASEYTKSGTLLDGNNAEPAQDGMSLRDYFAGQALAGWLASFSAKQSEKEVEAPLVATFAYRIADAMLAARNE